MAKEEILALIETVKSMADEEFQHTVQEPYMEFLDSFLAELDKEPSP